ncbi:30S ribosomal protein S6 [Patescibacteria group bacterium]|nr:30S ribosomal protein S6 [Patescibacteria group bacterium]MCG2694961.1 30S ribosomal protein S6 [Candidatus Parcubacteria bacterium]
MTKDTDINATGKVYEIGYLLLPVIAEENVSLEVSKIKDIIEKNKGMFFSEGIPEMRGLTYPMTKAISGKNQKFDSAYFGWVKFEADSDVINLIKNELEKIGNILRFLIIKTVKENTIVANSKVGKFSFDKKEGKPKKEKKVEEINKVDEKELDETIDELVIE